MRFRYLVLFTFFLFLSAQILLGADTKIPIEVKGDSIVYKEGGKIVQAKGNVLITYENMRLTCDEAEVDLSKNTARAKGNAILSDPRGVMHGDYMEYDFERQKGKILQADFEAKPYYGAAEELDRLGPDEYHAQSCYITTCDPSIPHPLNYRLEAKLVKIYPNQKVVAEDVKFKIGKYTLFYFPRYVHRLDQKRPNIKIVPGHDHDWGTFLLTTYKQSLNDSVDVKFNLDWREKRGIGFGPDVYYHSDWGAGIVRTYYIDEKDKEFLEELGGLRKEKRYKIQWIHRWDNGSNRRVLLELHKFSDYYLLKDYYYDEEFEYDPQPSSYLLFAQDDKYGTFSVYLKKRMNHFYTETEYLPQLKYTLYSTPLPWLSHLYLSGDTEFSNLSRRFSDGSSALSAWRWDNYLQLLYTTKVGYLEFSPFIGGRQTFYSRDKEGEDSFWRGVLYTGFDLSTHLYKVYSDNLRHVLRPYLSYRYNTEPTVLANKLQQFDWIDAIEKNHELLLGVENLVQKKDKDGNVFDFLKFDLESSYKIKPERGSYFDWLDLDLELKPIPDLRMDVEYRYGLDEGDWRDGSVDVWFTGLKGVSFGVGHEYRRDEMSQTVFETHWDVIPGWKFYTYHRYEFEDGAMQEQTYSVVKDLRCWELEMSYTDEKYGSDTFWIILRIKAFPDIGLKWHKSYRRRRD